MAEDTFTLPISFLESQKDNEFAKELLKLYNIYNRKEDTNKKYRKCSKCGIADGHNKATCSFIVKKKEKKDKKEKKKEKNDDIISDDEEEISDLIINNVKYLLYKNKSVTNYNYETVGSWDGNKIEWVDKKYIEDHKNHDDYSVD